MQESINLFWFRRDLRLTDNRALFEALSSTNPVLCLFIFDDYILSRLSAKHDARVSFIFQEVRGLDRELRSRGSQLLILYGKPVQVLQELIRQMPIDQVFCNRDYEPYAKQRDRAVDELLYKHDIRFRSSKDHVIFEALEVCKNDNSPYTVFTPYSKKWKSLLTDQYLTDYSSESHFDNFLQSDDLKVNIQQIESLDQIGFEPTELDFPEKEPAVEIIESYDRTRDFPAISGTSRLGIHLRFGTISIRQLVKYALKANATFLNELIWRDFYQMIVANFPHVVERAFRPKYDLISWRNDESEFKRWCQGMTGYPLVDAGMRELASTGYMHNRLRMVTASFLCKHLLIDWRWGEAWFAEKLLDFDLAANNGGWQWAAGCGTDAAPYFRVFNPELQMKKFDKDLKYVKKWVPEFGTPDYPEPIVDHKFARERALRVYKEGLAASS